jgi:hypothetical protein
MLDTQSESNNAKLTYEYTKDILREINDSYNAVTSKLTTALGFSGVLLRFAADLSDTAWLIHVKTLICVSLIFSVIACGIGLYPISSGDGAVDQDYYLKDKTGKYYGQTEEAVYIQLANGLSKSLKGIERNRKFRIKCLIATTYSIGIASIGFAISIMGKAELGAK